MKKLILTLASMMLLLTGCANKGADSIAVIGGADGPTAIFVTVKTNWFVMVAGIAAIIIIIAAIIYFIRRKK